MNKSFNVFRAFAFLSVFLFHCGFFMFGYLGVHAFFVLSGYLIMPIILKTKKSTSSIKEFIINFYGRRSLRIFPAYYFYLLIVTSVIFIYGWQTQTYYKDFIKQLPWALTYTYDFYHSTRFSLHSDLVSHFWSLSVEEQFYIFIPILFFLVKEKNLKVAFLIIIAAGPVLRALIGLAVTHNFLNLLFLDQRVTVYVMPFSHIDAFIIGGFFSIYLRKYIPSYGIILGSFILLILIGLIIPKWR